MSKRWTYLAVEVKPSMMGTQKTEEIQAELNRQGAMGWELVNVVFGAPMTAAILIFKKEA